jgi:transcriptional regulator with PAS, ATPase and Fis domain
MRAAARAVPENSKYGQAYTKQFQGLTQRAQITLSYHDWPGNVRELEYVISSAAISASGAFIDVGDLPVHLRKPLQGRTERRRIRRR